MHMTYSNHVGMAIATVYSNPDAPTAIVMQCGRPYACPRRWEYTSYDD